jgi:hypothetical protein
MNLRRINFIYSLYDKEHELYYVVFEYEDQTMDIKIYNKNKKYLHKIVNTKKFKSIRDERVNVV